MKPEKLKLTYSEFRMNKRAKDIRKELKNSRIKVSARQINNL